MRTMLRISMDAIKGSEVLKAGAVQKAIFRFVEKFSLGSTYVTVEDSMCSNLLFFNMKDSQ